MPTFNTCEMKQSFWKSVKYLWRYRIFAGTVYSLKVGNFKSCRWAKFSPSIAKVKYLRTWYFRPKCRLSTCVRWSKVFENRWNTFGDIGFLLGQFTGWKWEISNLVDGLSFHLVIAEKKIRAHLKFSAQMPTFNTFDMKQSFWKSVKYLWRYRIFAGTVYRLKVGNFKSCGWAKFSPCVLQK